MCLSEDFSTSRDPKVVALNCDRQTEYGMSLRHRNLMLGDRFIFKGALYQATDVDRAFRCEGCSFRYRITPSCRDVGLPACNKGVFGLIFKEIV